jgi:hypothetical protein
MMSVTLSIYESHTLFETRLLEVNPTLTNERDACVSGSGGGGRGEVKRVEHNNID